MSERRIPDAKESAENEMLDEPAEEQGEADRTPLSLRLRRALPYILIYARYVLPVVNVLVLLIMSFFYAVQVAGGGYTYEVSLVKLYANTFTGVRTYVTGKTATASNWFYGLLVTGAVVGILVFLLTAFLAVLGAVTAIRAFRAGHESEASNRMKVIFKIAFPNRIFLFLSNLALIVPALYPEYFSAIGGHFLLVGGESVIFVMLNRPLIVIASLLVVTLALAVAVSRLERQKKMNMLLIWHPQETDEAENEEQEES